MDSSKEAVVRLADASTKSSALVGGKTLNAANMMREGFKVPDGFCITTDAYTDFINHNRIAKTIDMEIGRKSLDEMRWEEIWDAALRIRTVFLSATMPDDLSREIVKLSRSLFSKQRLAVRSSAPGEDSDEISFAGLHESLLNIEPGEALLDAVRIVWASLWSDAAILYRKELSLNARESSMAVLVQEMVSETHSGVAFGLDPRDPRNDRCIIEAVPGLCNELVDGTTDPDRWVLERSSGVVVDWSPGKRDDTLQEREPLLPDTDVKAVYSALMKVELVLKCPADIEWTGSADRFTLLQARPISTVTTDNDDERKWYLSLRPADKKLSQLATRVSQVLIPELEKQGEAFANEDVDSFDDAALASSLIERLDANTKWKEIYWDEFIPFAHGVRRLGMYYNDAVRPEDPYEFLGILSGQEMLAKTRNNTIANLARMLASDECLSNSVIAAMTEDSEEEAEFVITRLEQIEGCEEFASSFNELVKTGMDVTYRNERLTEHPGSLLRNIIELSHKMKDSGEVELKTANRTSSAVLEKRLAEAVGESRKAEAAEMIRLGKLSWKLRDDDNILVGRLESQLMRAIQTAAARLRSRGMLEGEATTASKAVEAIANALLDPNSDKLVLEDRSQKEVTAQEGDGTQRPRQLVGQPAAPGISSGTARIIRNAADLGDFRSGEILVCDAIQPTMTHLVPLSSGVIERRGGMLIHGAIIAREMGIPCVNGVHAAAEILHNGDWLTVDGHLGIVTVGEPEFDIELPKSN